ncbi:MAG: hypothetical protein JWN14_451 [Chthonomonadales bacterium]|nr:hypothetical protein [Chthonomonadales bacterium]
MDYLQTTGDRLHDLELDRILARLRALEAAAGTTRSTAPAAAPSTPIVSAGVRSLTPAVGTQMFNDILLTTVGSISLSQAAQTVSFTVPVLVAGVGISLTPSGNNITIATTGGGGASVPSNVLVVSPGSTSFSWAVPVTVTEFNGLTIYRAQHDLTNATQARLVLLVDNGVSTPLSLPTLAVQYSLNHGAAWSYLDGGTGPSVGWATGESHSGWVTITGAALTDVLLRVVASGGDGSTSVSFASIYVQVK